MLGVLTVPEIDQVLERNKNGRIGYVAGGKVFVIPVTYVFNGDVLIMHSREGHKIHAMRLHPDVCFQVDEIHDQNNWRSVAVWGKYEEITDARERYYAMKFLVSRLLHLKLTEALAVHEHSEALPGNDGEKRPVIYRIRLTEKTGRYEQG